MQFVNPLMLFGLLAVAVPVVIHLLSRRQSAAVNWGAWMFLAATVRHRRRRVLLEEVLLLACRCLIPLLMALAFARPFLQHIDAARFGGGASKDVALIVDASASMSMVRDGDSNFRRAVAEARRYIEESPRGTAFSVILGGPVPQVLNPVPATDRRLLLSELDGVAPVNGTMRIGPNLSAAAVALAAGNNAAKQVVVVGDGQTTGWKIDSPESWLAVKRLFARLPSEPVVVWRTLPLPTSIRNLAVGEVRADRAMVGTDREVKLAVTVFNAGTETATPRGLTMEVGGGRLRAAGMRQLRPGESQQFVFTHRFARPGGAVVAVRLDAADDLPADDVAHTVIPVIGSLPVLVVEGNPAADVFRRGSTYVALALRPEFAHISGAAPAGAAPGAPGREFLLEATVEDFVAASRRSGFDGFAAVMLVDVPRVPDSLAGRLADYVAAGGGLFVMAGPRADRAFYNGWRRGEPLLPLELGESAPNEKASIDPGSFIGDSLRRLREGSDLSAAVPASYVKLNDRPGAPAEVVARLSNGDPLVATRPFGRGTVALSSIAFTPDSGATSCRGFVPLMHELAYLLARPVAVRLDVGPAETLSLMLAPSTAGAGLVGEYFPRKHCAGDPVKRADRQIAFNWREGPAMPGMPKDDFSVRWRGTVTPPESGRYEFHADVDDHFSFTLDGERRDAYDLERGRAYRFEGVYDENGGLAYVTLKWRRPDGVDEPVPAAAFGSDVNAAGVPVKVRDPRGVDFDAALVTSDGGVFLKAERSVTPGVYRVRSVPAQLRAALGDAVTPEGEIVFSVGAGVEESTMEAVTPAQVAELCKYVQVSTAISAEDVVKAIRGQSFGKEVWRYLALLAFVLLVAEVALARWIAVSRRTGEDIEVDFTDERLKASEAFRRSAERLNGGEGGRA